MHMRLLIATGLYPPEIGGPATYAKLFENELPRQGITVEVLPFSRVKHLPPLIRHGAYFIHVVRRARSQDVIVVQDTVSTGLPTILAARIVRVPCVVRVPGDYAWEQGVQRFGVRDSLDEFQLKRYGARVSLLRMIQRYVVRSASHVIAPSAYLGRMVALWGVPPHRLSVIYNGVQQGEAGEEKREAAHVLAVGRLVPWKGFKELIDVVSRHPDWRLTVVGAGPDREALEEFARAARAEGRIFFKGEMANDEVRALMRQATVFVLNSRYEGLSHTLIEACAEGMPIITTNIGGNPEVIEDGETGFLIEPGDTEALEERLTSVIGSAELRAAFSTRARERARRFFIDTTIRESAALFKKICASS